MVRRHRDDAAASKRQQRQGITELFGAPVGVGCGVRGADEDSDGWMGGVQPMRGLMADDWAKEKASVI